MKLTTSSLRMASGRLEKSFYDYPKTGQKLGEFVMLQYLSSEVWQNQLCIWKMGSRQNLINDALDKLWTYDLTFPGRSWRLVRGGSKLKVILTFKG